MKRLILPFLAALSLGACATSPTIYQVAAGPKAVGFSEYRIEPGRYRITFRGGPGAPPEQVTDYAVLRAADLALADGYDWFRISDRFVRQDGQGGGSRMSVGLGGGGGYGGGLGVGVGTSFPIGGGPVLISTIEVVMGKGAKPALADVYDARGVRDSIGPRT